MGGTAKPDDRVSTVYISYDNAKLSLFTSRLYPQITFDQSSFQSMSISLRRFINRHYPLEISF